MTILLRLCSWVLLVIGLSVAVGIGPARGEGKKKCLILQSYHNGYAWSDGIEKSAKDLLAPRCDVSVFYMDTKRNPDKEYGLKKGLEAKALIDSSKPDIVIAVDDPASEYVVSRFYKDAQTPFIFCGVNWSVDKYKYPYKNVTGMIEITPVKDMLKDLKGILPKLRKAVYLSGNVPTDLDNFKNSVPIFKEVGVTLESRYVTDMADWKKAYKEVQSYDLILFANNAGIKDWDEKAVIDWQKKHTKKLVLTNIEHMVKFAMFGIVKLASEQGEWAAQAAIQVMDGTPIAEIPIIPNRQRDLYWNENFVKLTSTRFPASFSKNAIKVSQ